MRRLARLARIGSPSLLVARIVILIEQPIADVVVLSSGCGGRGPLGDVLYVFHLWPLLASDAGAQLHLELQHADLQTIAVSQFALANHALFVHQRAILAAEIAHGAEPFLNQQQAMMATDQVAVRAQMAIVGAPDEKLFDRYFDFLTSAATGEQLDRQFHTAPLFRLVVRLIGK